MISTLRKLVNKHYSAWIEAFNKKLSNILLRGKVYYPPNLRITIIKLNNYNETAGHLGIKRTYELIRRWYTLPNLKKI